MSQETWYSLKYREDNNAQNKSKYHLQIGETSACKKIIMESTKGIGQRYIKGVRDCFIFDS